MPAKRKSAFSAVMREAQQQHSETVTPQDREAVEQQQSSTVEQLEGEAVKLLHSETVTQSSGEASTQQGREAVELHYRETDKRLYSNTVIQQDSSIVTPSHRLTVKKEAKISFYFTAEQEKKLDTLELEYRIRTGRRINRNDIMRYLLDHCNIEDLIVGMGEPTA